jgi:hypothetical protein
MAPAHARAAAETSPASSSSEEIIYKGHRIEPESYAVHSSAWSPRVVVSLRIEKGWSRGAPLYSTSAARFPTRDEADRQAVDVARAWIDRAIERGVTDTAEPIGRRSGDMGDGEGLAPRR